MAQEYKSTYGKTEPVVLAGDGKRETIGWLSMSLLIFVYPALFFACAYFPMWVGWAP